MKKLNYIFLFIILGFLGKAVAAPSNSFSSLLVTKEKAKLEASVKSSESLNKSEVVKKKFSSKFSKKKRPKKPKGIPVIVPVVSSHNFNSFCNYSEFSLHEVKGNYSLLLHYSHGKRGPPSSRA